jgi:uncharacterized membrane protein YgcG
VKNPAVTAALVLVALALVVGGFAWMASGAAGEGGTATVLTPVAATPVSFAALSPREQRKKNNLEDARRELHNIREQGEEIAPGMFRIKDETGEATYYLGDLLPGKGRDGEPMYLSVQMKRLPAPPLKELTKKGAKKIKNVDTKKHTNIFKYGESTKDGAAGLEGSGGDGTGSGSGGDAGGGGSGDGGGNSGKGGGAGGNPPK